MIIPQKGNIREKFYVKRDNLGMKGNILRKIPGKLASKESTLMT